MEEDAAAHSSFRAQVDATVEAAQRELIGLEERKKEELKTLAMRFSVPTSGTKEELVTR